MANLGWDMILISSLKIGVRSHMSLALVYVLRLQNYLMWCNVLVVIDTLLVVRVRPSYDVVS